jgi:uncharacterized protein YcbK (DUF882 family)
MNYLFSSQDPFFVEKNPKYRPKPQKFPKILFLFVQRVDQYKLMTDQGDLTMIEIIENHEKLMNSRKMKELQEIRGKRRNSKKFEKNEEIPGNSRKTKEFQEIQENLVNSRKIRISMNFRKIDENQDMRGKSRKTRVRVGSMKS